MAVCDSEPLGYELAGAWVSHAGADLADVFSRPKPRGGACRRSVEVASDPVTGLAAGSPGEGLPERGRN